ncbi:MAG: NADAR family protein [Lachnospiraceae bacterium]|nr:NADAR family protein [Lachnospiraceae bacterium]
MAETYGENILVFRTANDEWGEFSNQYPSPFTYMGNRFETVEQFLYYMRAVFGRSKATAEKILACGGDSDALSRAGRKQLLLENNRWEEVCPQIMRLGMRQKFLQNPELRKKLLGTGCRLLVENPKDGLLGFIFSAGDDWIRNPAKWKDRNLTGKVLMQVRADLRCADRLVGSDEAYVFPKAPFILQTPIGKMTLQEISALPGTKKSIHAYEETARQYLELFLASPGNVGDLNKIPLIAMERFIAKNNAEVANTLSRAKAVEAAVAKAREEAIAALNAEGAGEAEAEAAAEEAAEKAAEKAAEEAAAFAETEAAETPVPLEEQPGTVPAAEDMADAESENNDEKFPDDIPAEGFYELLFDLDEMMKLGII